MKYFVGYIYQYMEAVINYNPSKPKFKNNKKHIFTEVY